MDVRKAITYGGAACLGAWLGVRLVRTLRGYDFRNRVVVITGGTRGLGLVIARQLAREGARLAVCARDEAEVSCAHLELTGRAARVYAQPCDIRNSREAEQFIRNVEQEFGRVDVLINNAGIISVGPESTMTQADYVDAMATHFWAPLYMIRAVLPGMRQRGEGRIVNITSIGGKISVPHLLPYSASKFALVGLSQGLRAELVRDGIVVTTVCPGLMRTGSPRNATFKGQHRMEYAWFALGDALPGLSISAESAARRIINACRRGDAEILLGLPTRLAVLAHGVLPGLTADILGLVNRLLPGPGGIGEQGVLGSESESNLIPSVLTAPNQRAAQRNNEILSRGNRGGQ